MKVKKKFKYKDLELMIVEREEPYMNGGSVKMTRVIGPNGGTIPVNFRHKQTLKSIIQDTIEALENFARMGANVKEELTKKI